MRGFGRKTIAVGAVTALLATIGVGGASAATTSHVPTKAAATRKSATVKPRVANRVKLRREERESPAMTGREKRGPGFPREERGESLSTKAKEQRNHAEVRRTVSKTYNSAHRSAGNSAKH